MFQQLHNYFFQYKTLGIPGVGTLRMVQQSATLDVVNQALVAPQVQVEFSRQVAVGDHQIQTLAYAFNNDLEVVEEQLTRFGEALRSRLQHQPFAWQGVGKLELEGAHIYFEPQQRADALLEPVPAHRVLRENAQHTVLVGDQEMQRTSEDYESELQHQEAPRRSLVVILGWVAVLLSLAFVIYHLYISNWAPSATGLRQKPYVQQTPRQYNQ